MKYLFSKDNTTVRIPDAGMQDSELGVGLGV
jgi:hypothetical protein